MLLAAGLGTRMRPLTDRTAKPLLPLGGRALIDHALDRLAEAGVETVVVNAHWQADRVAAHLAPRAPAARAPSCGARQPLLETGGGVQGGARPARARRRSSSSTATPSGWTGRVRRSHRLAAAFDPDEVDGVLLVHRTFQVHADVGFGDFAVDTWGVPRRRGEREVVPYIYAGVQLIAPALLAGTPDGAFSMNRAWDTRHGGRPAARGGA